MRPIPISELTLKQAKNRYRYRIKMRIPINDELNDYLAQNWVGYDPIKRIYVRKSVNELTLEQAKSRFDFCRRRGIPVSDKLHEFLAQNWDAYDPQIRDVKKEKRTNRGVWRKPAQELTQAGALNRFNNLVANGIPIPDDLNDRMAELFPQYDPVKRDMPRGKQKKPLNKLSKYGLRKRFYVHINNGEPIEDDLNEYMAANWQTYDPQIRDFKNRKSTIRTKEQNMNEQNTNTNVSTPQENQSSQTGFRTPHTKFSASTALNRYYQEKKDFGKPTYKTHCAMMVHFPDDYNPETKIYRKRPLQVSKMNPKQVAGRFNYMKKHGLPITDDVNDAMAKFYPATYYPELRDYGPKKFEYCSKFTRKDKYNKLRSRRAAGEQLTELELLFIKQYIEHLKSEQQNDSNIKPAKKISVAQKDSTTKNKKKPPIMNASELYESETLDVDIDEALMALGNGPRRQNGGNRRRNNETFISTATGKLVVTVNSGKYKTVSINDVPVITMAQKVKVKTFMNKLVLAVHYTDIKNTAQWRLWDAAAKPIVISDDSDVVIEKVNYADNVLYMATDDHSLVSMSKKNILRNITNPVQFKIKQTKTR